MIPTNGITNLLLSIEMHDVEYTRFTSHLQDIVVASSRPVQSVPGQIESKEGGLAEVSRGAAADSHDPESP